MMANDKRIVMGASIFKALAHPTRLFVVEELSERDHMCVCEITEMIGADISTISRHLAILRNAGIVTSSKVGNEVHYRLAIPCVLEFLTCVENVIEMKRRELING